MGMMSSPALRGNPTIVSLNDQDRSELFQQDFAGFVN